MPSASGSTSSSDLPPLGLPAPREFAQGGLVDVLAADPEFLRDPGPTIQRAAEEHLAAVWAAEDEEDDEASPAAAPFCGCETCVVREVIAGAWPVIEAYYSLQYASNVLNLAMSGERVARPRRPHRDS